MDPSIWGPKVWDFLLNISLKADPQYVLPVIDMYAACLPCIHCRRSFKEYCKQLPPTSMAKSSEELFKWVWTMHDMVNQKLGKQSLTYEKTKRRYSTFMCYISCIDVVDILTCMVCCTYKEDNQEGMFKIASSLPDIKYLLQTNSIFGGTFMCEDIKCIKPLTNDGILNAILLLRSKARVKFNMGKETREQVLMRFPISTAKSDTIQKLDKTSNGTRDRRQNLQGQEKPNTTRRVPRNIRKKQTTKNQREN